MSNAFAWFHNGSDNPSDSVAFYEKLLGWRHSDGPPGMTMLGPVLFDYDQRTRTSDRKRLTVDMEESSWYIQGARMCLRRSLCGHHATLDTDNWIKMPFDPYHIEKSFSKIVRLLRVVDRQLWGSSGIAGGVLDRDHTQT